MSLGHLILTESKKTKKPVMLEMCQRIQQPTERTLGSQNWKNLATKYKIHIDPSTMKKK